MLFGIFFIIIVAFLGLLAGVGGTILWIWAIVDCIQNKRLRDNDKTLWILLIVFTHFIGAIIYFVAGRSSNRMASYPYVGQQQPYQYPYAAPDQQQPYAAPDQQQPYQYYQPPMPMQQTQQASYSEAPQAHYPEPYPPQD